MSEQLNKEQVLFYLNRLGKRVEVPSQEEMAKRGVPYHARKVAEDQREEVAQEQQAVEIAKRVVEQFYKTDVDQVVGFMKQVRSIGENAGCQAADIVRGTMLNAEEATGAVSLLLEQKRIEKGQFEHYKTGTMCPGLRLARTE